MQLCVVMTMVFRDWKYQSPVKRKCHFYEGFAVGCSESCHFDKFRCILWPQFRQSDDIPFSVIISKYVEHNFELKRLHCYLFKDRGMDDTKLKNIPCSEWHTSFRGCLHMDRKRDCRLDVNTLIGIILQWKVNVTGWRIEAVCKNVSGRKEFLFGKNSCIGKDNGIFHLTGSVITTFCKRLFWTMCNSTKVCWTNVAGRHLQSR